MVVNTSTHKTNIWVGMYEWRESAEKLRNFTNTFNQHWQALQALNQNKDDWSALFLHVITSKLDPCTLCNWEKLMAKKKLPSIQTQVDFLQERCQILEAKNNTKDMKKIVKFDNKINVPKFRSYVITKISLKCYMCQQP